MAILALGPLLATSSSALAATGYTAGAPGDADCSAAVTAADALVVLDELAGFEAHNSACGADTDGDGVDIGDALAIRRWVAGLAVRPNLEDVLPGAVPVGSAATTFTLTGGFFGGSTVVEWNGTPYPITLLDSGSRATVVIPASELDTQGGFVLALITPGQPASAGLEFEVTAPGTCSEPVATSGTLVVTKDSTPETAIFSLNAPQDMTGWTLVSIQGTQKFPFPAGYIFQPALGPVTIESGTAEFADSQTRLHWTGQNIWLNSAPDSGELRNCLGNVIAEWIDPETDTN